MPVSPDPNDARRLDAVAVRAALRRLARAPGAPWLHGEIARRMGEKLAVILLQPERVIDWWSALGGGSGLLAAAYPKAQQLRVEPDP
ncbi:MAG: biotin synthase, partial [Rhizobiales bacterium]|nr:biotin synthase [Rhizobacter sp.]